MFFQWRHPNCLAWLAIIVLLDCSLYCVYANDEKPIFAPKLRLIDGNEIPVLGLGTSQARASEGEQAVKDAIDIGYRHIDTAYVYGNEKEVGNAIRAKIAEGVIKREDIYVVTKLWCTFHEPDQVSKAFQKSLDNLNISYIDLYLMHAPVAFQRIKKTANLTGDEIDDTELFSLDANGNRLSADIDYVDTWKAMEDLHKTGKVRSLGVSNFNSEQLDRLVSSATIKPVANQVECHANLNQKKLIEFSNAKNITTIAYSPLGRPGNTKGEIALKNPKVQEIADKYKKNAGQVVLRYAIQNGAVAIPKSTNKARLRGNIDIFDFSLTKEEMTFLDSLNSNLRLIKFDQDKDNKYYPFNIEF